MKRFAILVMGLTVILTASAAFAVVQDFGEYTVDVIDGWTAIPQGKIVYFVKNDNSASWSVMFDDLPGKMSVEQYAKGLMKQLNGSNFEADGKNFRFEFKNPNGQTTHAMIFAITEKRFMQWGISGFETAGDEIKKLTGSMKPKSSRSTAKNSEIDKVMDSNGNTKLILAAYRGKTGEVKNLLAEGADVNIKNKWGMTALMYAAEGNHEEIAEILLEAGADIDAVNNEGSTALIIASIHNSNEVTSVLLEAGADVEIQNNDGKTAADY